MLENGQPYLTQVIYIHRSKLVTSNDERLDFAVVINYHETVYQFERNFKEPLLSNGKYNEKHNIFVLVSKGLITWKSVMCLFVNFKGEIEPNTMLGSMFYSL